MQMDFNLRYKWYFPYIRGRTFINNHNTSPHKIIYRLSKIKTINRRFGYCMCLPKLVHISCESWRYCPNMVKNQPTFIFFNDIYEYLPNIGRYLKYRPFIFQLVVFIWFLLIISFISVNTKKEYLNSLWVQSDIFLLFRQRISDMIQSAKSWTENLFL